jgi:hypothetical protein
MILSGVAARKAAEEVNIKEKKRIIILHMQGNICVWRMQRKKLSRLCDISTFSKLPEVI